MSSTPDTPSSSGKRKIVVWVILAVVVVGFVATFAITRTLNTTAPSGPSSAATPNSTQSTGQVVREDSRVLSQAPQENAVLVEFLDFECEACGAFYPLVEDLRAQYGENVTFVNRYFPLPGHRNSMTAAIAVESAGQQGAYEAMYQRMFETQSQWGESADDKSDLFRTYAEELDLDMGAYDAAVADPATQARIEADVIDGTALGVNGTPTFFLDGERLTPETEEQFRDAIEDAAAN